jgi:hypothetical protein
LSVGHSRLALISESPNAVLGTKENQVTKKDYELIAKVIKEMHDKYDGDDWTVNGTIYLYASNLAAVFNKDNPNFHQEKFMEACGA